MGNRRVIYKSLIRLTEALLNSRNGNVPPICAWVRMDMGLSQQEITEVLAPIWEQWPRFSGVTEFPVTSSNNKPQLLFKEARAQRTRYWSRNTEYGASRRELLTFLIHTLLTQIHEVESNQPTIKQL